MISNLKHLSINLFLPIVCFLNCGELNDSTNSDSSGGSISYNASGETDYTEEDELDIDEYEKISLGIDISDAHLTAPSFPNASELSFDASIINNPFVGCVNLIQDLSTGKSLILLPTKTLPTGPMIQTQRARVTQSPTTRKFIAAIQIGPKS